jgi:hypothetical protein
MLRYDTPLIVSDGCASGGVLGTGQEVMWECKGIAQEVTQWTPTELKGMVASPAYSFFLTHYLRYIWTFILLTICLSPSLPAYYCDNSSRITNEEALHSRDIDSSS